MKFRTSLTCLLRLNRQGRFLGKRDHFGFLSGLQAFAGCFPVKCRPTSNRSQFMPYPAGKRALGRLTPLSPTGIIPVTLVFRNPERQARKKWLRLPETPGGAFIVLFWTWWALL